MLNFNYDAFEIRISNQFHHTFGSSDNARSYERETFLNDVSGYISSQHAVVVCQGEEEIRSHLLAADGGASGIHEHSALIHEDKLFLAVGDCLCALEIPSLDLVWKTKVDMATCFGVYLPPRRNCLISRGELEISRVSFDGEIVWQSSGADIFTGDFEVFENHIEAQDWNGWRYRIEMETGKSELI